MLQKFFISTASIKNKAIGGRSARRFIDEGRLDNILKIIEPSDYLFLQFGTNDGHRTATYTINGVKIPYYLDPQTDFKLYLQKYIEGIRRQKANITGLSTWWQEDLPKQKPSRCLVDNPSRHSIVPFLII